jgi:hypothetical protein
VYAKNKITKVLDLCFLKEEEVKKAREVKRWKGGKKPK